MRDALARTMVVDADRMAADIAAGQGLFLAEAASFALANHLPRATAQQLVKSACGDALSAGRDMIQLLAERTTAPVDWDQLRQQALHPPCADMLINRVLAAHRRS